MDPRKVWLDDERPAPDGWLCARRPEEAIAHLQSGLVTHLCLDHDLGDDASGTGYDVLVWIEEAVTRGFEPPNVITIHSINAGARPRMELAVAEIRQLVTEIP
jgi:hypothetical protein